MSESNGSRPYEDEVSLLELLAVLADNARTLVFVPLAIGILALCLAFAMSPIFTATTTILPPQQQQSTAAILASQLGAFAGLAGLGGGGLKNPADLYIALIRSRTVADRLIERFGLMKVYETDMRQDARRTLRQVTRVTAGKDGLITIEVEDVDSKRAAAIANAYVEELARLMDSLAITEAQQRRVFFAKELENAREGLKRAELALGQTGAGEALIRSAPQTLIEGVARLKAQVTAQEVKLSTMRGYLTEGSPEFQQAQRELSSLKVQLARTERDESPAGSHGVEYLKRFRDFKYQEALFELLAKQYESARLDEAREGATIQIVDTAQPPERKSKPRKALIAVLTTLATATLLGLFVFAREAFRNALNVPESASKLARVEAGFRGLLRRARQ